MTHQNGAPRWATRPEQATDMEAIHRVNAQAFETEDEAQLVDALRQDPQAWIEALSIVTTAPDGGEVVAHALLTRCHVGGEAALALAPCATLPLHQRSGAGSAAIRAGLEAARSHGENLVVVLGHAAYYPRFGFVPAASMGVTAPFEVPGDHFLALALDPSRPTPRGEISYPAAFGI